MERLAALFPEENFAFHLGLGRADAAEFFRPRAASGALLAQRRQWLDDCPARYASLRPEGAPLFEELIELSRAWGVPAARDIVALATTWEPDVLLLGRDAEGRLRLQGGALVFPTGWALEEKLGGTVSAIHAVVPGLNRALAGSIDRFLDKIPANAATCRSNWGLAATAELNAHPARRLPAPAPPVALDRLWLRVEHQAFVALPRTGGVVFAIRIALHRLDAAIREPGVAPGLRRALATMSPDVAAYKRIDAISVELQRILARA